MSVRCRTAETFSSCSPFSSPFFSTCPSERASESNPSVSPALSFRDIQNLGVNLLGHQRKILNAAQQLRAYLTQGQVEV